MKRYVLLYIRLLFVVIILVTVLIKLTGNRFKEINPISWKTLIEFHLFDIVIMSVFISIGLFGGCLHVKKKSDSFKETIDGEKSYKSLSDPVLDKIIEDALNGKKATEDSESEVDYTENVEKEGSDVKN